MEDNSLNNLKTLKILQSSLLRQISEGEREGGLRGTEFATQTIQKIINLASQFLEEYQYLKNLVHIPPMPKVTDNGTFVFFKSHQLKPFFESIQMIVDTQEEILGSRLPIREDKIFITHG